MREPANLYFWRTYDGKEIDLVEEKGGQLTGLECKWTMPHKTVAPKEWLSSYPNASYKMVSSETYEQYLI
ncbi:MAG: DUF4143 domain-containing protein [Candidatus Taylorbacteria bacterium]|nr:DUF4143 domain-containing protein [Candidatus Taylorbacteria bacterium]